MAVTFRLLSEAEQKQLGQALRRNADTGQALHMAPDDTRFLATPEADPEIESLINAIKSVPCHYAMSDAIGLGSVADIDIGFDPRVHGMAVQLSQPMRPGQRYRIAYSSRRVGDTPTKTLTVEGTPAEVLAVLAAAGYKIVAGEAVQP